MTDAASWTGVGIAAGSLVVAIIAIVKSGRAQRQANAAQQRIVAIEEQREQDRRSESTQARLTPELRETSPNTYRLYLVNHGAAEARNIRVELDGKPLAAHPVAVTNNSMPGLVGPRGEIGCILGIYMGCEPPFGIRIMWDDDFGKDRSCRTTLTW